MLAAFADLVRTPAPGPSRSWMRPDHRAPAGPGLDVFGVDLSPVMIGLAREAYPDLRFEVGSMDALTWPTAS